MLLIAEKYMELAERAERRGKEDPSEEGAIAALAVVSP
jgi:hypothetical protein